MAIKGFLIAATSSGCGKTTLALGLMRELTRRGLNVQPFKCGPDYIDTQFHREATGKDSINLDTFMSSEQHVRNLFMKYSYDKDVAVVEGMMGMCDGYDKMMGSCADISRLLRIPIVLVINASSSAYSVAATIYGFKNFIPDIRIAGIIFNRVASESHLSLLKDACSDTGVECLGYIRRDTNLQIPSRHLGLTLTPREEMETFINCAADSVAATVNIDRLLSQTTTENDKNDLQLSGTETSLHHQANIGKVAGIAFDEAFSFIYPANIEKLKYQGYNIKYFSLIHHSYPPEHADFIYLPGGYPELFAKELSKNKSMMHSIRDYIENDGKMWAECGGLIYLSEEIDGNKMCGVFPLKCTMENAKLSLGYRSVDFGDFSFKGHEFHYSHITNQETIASVAIQTNVRGMKVETPIYRYKNAFASYTHLYWADKDIFKLWNL